MNTASPNIPSFQFQYFLVQLQSISRNVLDAILDPRLQQNMINEIDAL